jgi:hypothetical protein
MGINESHLSRDSHANFEHIVLLKGGIDIVLSSISHAPATNIELLCELLFYIFWYTSHGCNVEFCASAESISVLVPIYLASLSYQGLVDVRQAITLCSFLRAWTQYLNSKFWAHKSCFLFSKLLQLYFLKLSWHSLIILQDDFLYACFVRFPNAFSFCLHFGNLNRDQVATFKNLLSFFYLVHQCVVNSNSPIVYLRTSSSRW